MKKSPTYFDMYSLASNQVGDYFKFLWPFQKTWALKTAQFNYISRNQLHCTANLNFGLMCKKAKHCWGFVNDHFISIQLIVFLDLVLLLAELAKNSNYFKIAVWRSERELQGFTCKSWFKSRTLTILFFGKENTRL